MKKYLINGAMALIVGGFIASCTHDDVGAPATVNDRTKSFDEMFTELYGPIAENHNWGFATVAVPAEAIAAAEAEAAAATRAATRAVGDITGSWSEGYDASFSNQFYLALDAALPEQKEAGDKKNNYEFISNGQIKFSVVFSETNGNDKVGIYYYDPTTETAEQNHKVQFVDNIQNIFNYVKIKWSDGRVENIYTNWGIAAWKTWGDTPGSIAKIYTINIPSGYRVGFYVERDDFPGMTMYSNQSLNNDVREEGSRYYSAVVEDNTHNTFFVGLEDWPFKYEQDLTNPQHPADCNDIVIAIDKNTDTPPTVVEIAPRNPDAYQESKTKKTYTYKKIVDQGRVFCEDIATANMKVTEDIDYNDIVFDARVWEIYDQDSTTINNITSYSDPYNYRWQYDISLLATGGTIEEKINGIDVHNKFGVGQAFMVNTWTPNCVSTLSGQWNTPTNVIQPKDFSYTLTYDELPLDPEDNSKRLAGINTIPIEVHYGGKQMVALENRKVEERTSEDGKKYIVSSAPYKLCLPVGTQWPIERVNIENAYKYFSAYVADPTYAFYNSDKDDDKLYTQALDSSIQKDGKTTESPKEVTQSGDAENSIVYVVWKGDVSKDGSPITLYNFTFQGGQTLRFFGSGSGTITVACGDNNSMSLISNRSMSAGYVDVPITPEQASALSAGIMIYGSNFSLTKIVVL